MTDALNPTVPAGWYPDPWGAPEQRWWDGFAWTENLHPSPSSEVPAHAAEPERAHAHRAAPEPEAAPGNTDSPFPSRRALRELGVTTGTIPIIGSEDFVLPEPISAVAAEPAVVPAESTAAPAVDLPPEFRLEPELHEEPEFSAEPAPTFATETPLLATAIADPLPPFTHVPEFTPEPVSALPPPVWTEADQAGLDAATVVAEAAAAAAAEEPIPVATAEPTATTAAPEPTPAPTIPDVASEPGASGTEGWMPVASAPIPVTTDDWAASLSKWDDVEATAPSDALPIFGDAPPVSYSQRVMRYQPLHGRTSAVWFIVLMPLLHTAAVIGSLFLFPRMLGFSGSVSALIPTEASLVAVRDWMLFAAAPLALAFFVFTLIMGFQDRARLRLLGHDQTASPWWVLLHPFIYLIVRSVRVRQSTGRKGSGPLTTYICLYIAPSIAAGIATAVISALDGAIPS